MTKKRSMTQSRNQTKNSRKFEELNMSNKIKFWEGKKIERVITKKNQLKKKILVVLQKKLEKVLQVK